MKLNEEHFFIERVEKLFPLKKAQDFPKRSHKYNHYKLPRIPSFNFSKKKISKALNNASYLTKKDLKRDALHTHQCCANPKKFIPITNPKKTGWTSKRVETWRLKAFLLATKKLRKMITSYPVQKYKITKIIKKDPQAELNKQQTNAWQELIKLNEERHFHLTRITRILSD